MSANRLWLRVAIYATAAFTAGLVLLAGATWWWLERPLDLRESPVELSIEPGTSPREVAQRWVDAGVASSPRVLYEWFRWSGQATKIRAGSYAIEGSVSPRQLLNMMVRGEETLESITFIEGWTFRQVRRALGQAPHLRPVTAGMDETTILRMLGADTSSAEGRFFPDTYLYSRGVSDLTVLRRAYRSMEKRLQQVWAERADGLPLGSAHDALILASIVEKETGREVDRSRIAAVFINRLRLGMPLQTDPTVIYGLGEAFDGNLRKRDLLADTPWNTYTRRGLPPTPIAMPGLASLRAAVRPLASRELYFVARGDGSSIFSETLEAHNRAVNQFQRGQR